MRSYLNISYGPHTRHELDIHLPDEGTPVRAAFLYFHGGGLEGGTRQIKKEAYRLPDNGIAFITASYRIYPDAKFPDFVEDSALAVAWVKEHLKEYADCDKLFVGGSSAGGWLSMMLYFDPHYLADQGVDADSLSGYVFNAGQPTTHFNVLRERGMNSSLIRVDEAAPVYFVDDALIKRPALPLFFITAEHDMPCRPEQTAMMLKTLEMLGYPQDKISSYTFPGFKHCKYNWNEEFTQLLIDFMLKNC